MADKANAIKNDLNRRAREVGIFDQELTLQDLAAVRSFYGFTCLNPECGKKPATSIDHVIPLSEGGQNTIDNLQLLCTNCNKQKGARVEDYRKGNVVPADYVAPESDRFETQEKTRRNKVDWSALRLEYVTGNMSIRDLAARDGIPESTLFYQATEIGDWNKQRIEFRSKVVALSEQAIAEKEVSARSLTFDLGVEIVQDWRRNIKRNTTAAEVTGILKVLLAMQGQAAERVEHVESEQSDAELFNRITRAFDPGEEERGYTPVGDSGEESGAGWSD
jgi:hypothetical protein